MKKQEYTSSPGNRPDHLWRSLAPDWIIEYFLSEECMKRFMQTEHLRWNAERIIAGYKEGEVRDPVYKIHPHIRPYCELSKEVLMNDQRVIDALPKLVQMAGYEIVELQSV